MENARAESRSQILFPALSISFLLYNRFFTRRKYFWVLSQPAKEGKLQSGLYFFFFLSFKNFFPFFFFFLFLNFPSFFPPQNQLGSAGTTRSFHPSFQGCQGNFLLPSPGLSPDSNPSPRYQTKPPILFPHLLREIQGSSQDKLVDLSPNINIKASNTLLGCRGDN